MTEPKNENATRDIRDMLAEYVNGEQGFSVIEKGADQFALMHYEGGDFWLITVQPAEVVAKDA